MRYKYNRRFFVTRLVSLGVDDPVPRRYHRKELRSLEVLDRPVQTISSAKVVTRVLHLCTTKEIKNRFIKYIVSLTVNRNTYGNSLSSLFRRRTPRPILCRYVR